MTSFSLNLPSTYSHTHSFKRYKGILDNACRRMFRLSGPRCLHRYRVTQTDKSGSRAGPPLLNRSMVANTTFGLHDTAFRNQQEASHRPQTGFKWGPAQNSVIITL
ncbi:Hypothetical predicted protein [Xyrichtys novacula]|uniref:Uncharacterized protein n=1 Tax=Xyrichtys novacula TaxID=13765 RepID=A0AAV1HHW4_XYRNO|nr:Hypothetical predicted protein [Xyrichtys novacula]